MLDIQFAAAKVNKYASRESGDTIEIVERSAAPGGFTIVLVDGQGSGRNAKTLSHFVTGKAIALLKDGVRDGAVARAVSDQLYAYRHGQVSATLNLITVDFVTRTLVITRNNPEPVFKYQVTSIKYQVSSVKDNSEVGSTKSEPSNKYQVSSIKELENKNQKLENKNLFPDNRQPTTDNLSNNQQLTTNNLFPDDQQLETRNFKLETLNSEAVPIGIYPRTRPVVTEFELEPGLIIVAFSDGISQAGLRYEQKLDIEAVLGQLISNPDQPIQAQYIADELLEAAIKADRRRPQDDMSVVVVTTAEFAADEGDPLPRRLSLNIPFL